MLPIPKFSTSFGKKLFKNHVAHSEFQSNKQKIQFSTGNSNSSDMNGKKSEKMFYILLLF